MLDIVTITDFQSPSTDDKVQVYISGTLHGDEVIGPQVAYYLLEYLLTNYLHDPEVTHMLKTREIIITPMTNAVGYYNQEREERINQLHENVRGNKARREDRRVPYSVDINRDFPYNVLGSEECLNTIAGRVIH